MKIYIGHSTELNFKEDLYKPLRDSKIIEKNKLVFPHEDSDKLFNSKKFLKSECELFIAEVSKASTGLGIELGWASIFEVPIICVLRDGSEPSSALKAVTEDFIEYNSSKELVSLLEEEIDKTG